MWKYVAALGVVFLAGAALLQQGAAAQPGAAIKVAAPAANSTVSGPVMLQVDISGVPVKPAGEGDPQAFHYHALVDVDPATVIQPGQPIPTGQANIIHTADLRLALPDLAPGPHTVTVILTRTDHVPLTPAIQDRVTFTVAAAGAAPATGGQAGAAAAPRVGRGGELLTDNRASVQLALIVAGVLLLGVGGVALRVRR